MIPGSFFTDDTGTVMVYVTNGNSDQSVVVNHVTIGDKDIRLTELTLRFLSQYWSSPETIVCFFRYRTMLEMERITRHFP